MKKEKRAGGEHEKWWCAREKGEGECVCVWGGGGGGEEGGSEAGLLRTNPKIRGL